MLQALIPKAENYLSMSYNCLYVATWCIKITLERDGAVKGKHLWQQPQRQHQSRMARKAVEAEKAAQKALETATEIVIEMIMEWASNIESNSVIW